MYKNFCILRSYCFDSVLNESSDIGIKFIIPIISIDRSNMEAWKKCRVWRDYERGKNEVFSFPPVSRWWEARGVELWRVRTTWEEVLERSGVGLIVLFFCLILFRDILSFLSFLTPSSSSSQAWKHRFRGIPPDFIGHLIPVGEFNFLKILLEV